MNGLFTNNSISPSTLIPKKINLPIAYQLATLDQKLSSFEKIYSITANSQYDRFCNIGNTHLYRQYPI